MKGASVHSYCVLRYGKYGSAAILTVHIGLFNKTKIKKKLRSDLAFELLFMGVSVRESFQLPKRIFDQQKCCVSVSTVQITKYLTGYI